MEDFVTYEIAKKLKENGFKEPCFGWYYPSEVCGYDYRTLIVRNRSEYRGDQYKDLLISHNDDKHIDAPTIEQVLKWLRDNKKTIDSILPVAFNRKENKFTKYNYTIYYITEEFLECHEGPETFGTYEECALEAIEYAIDNLI